MVQVMFGHRLLHRYSNWSIFIRRSQCFIGNNRRKSSAEASEYNSDRLETLTMNSCEIEEFIKEWEQNYTTMSSLKKSSNSP